MSVTRNNLAQLYTPIYDEFMLASYAQHEQVHPMIYDVVMDPTKDWKNDDISGTGRWTTADEGTGGGYQDPIEGYPTTISPAKRWAKIALSFETIDQDEYALAKKIGEASEMGKGAKDDIETNTANYLINGFTTASSPDGKYLFDTDHPKNRVETGTTYDNLLSGAFSHDALEAAETQIAANYFDERGIPIPPSTKPVLLYPPALRGAVARVLDARANERPGVTTRDINRFAGKYTPIEWQYLSVACGGSNTAWFIMYPSLGFLKVVMNSKPHFTSWVDEDLEFINFKGRFLYDYAAINWRCGFGSTGS